MTCAPAGMVLIVDDLLTTGTTMKRALDALHAAGATAYGFGWCGND